MKPWLPAAVALASAGCGYIGEPLPPLLNIPERITDLAAVQRGGKIIAQFTAPRLTTEGVVMRTAPRLELRAGEGGDPFDADRWAERSPVITSGVVEDGRARYEFPAAAWTGKEIILGARAVAANGRDSGWSNLVVLRVAPPPQQPVGLRGESVPDGVRLTWQGAGGRFRVYRHGEGETPAPVATAEGTAWVDTTAEAGKTYTYVVQALVNTGENEAESELSAPAGVVVEDRRPPAAPTGVTAAASAGSIQIVWDRNAEADLAGYRVYRSVSEGQRALAADMLTAPLYTDRAIEPGKTYSYTVSAVDKSGNESGQSEAAEATAPEP
ncbi:MAG: fibronectin type III domain-containing protein [Bryobacteraceae bacterium]